MTATLAELNVETKPDINEHIKQYNIAKMELDAAKHAFAEAESALLSLVGHKSEGTYHYEADDFKVTTTGRINRKIDTDKMWQLKEKLSEELFNMLFTFKPQLDVKVFKKLAETDPDQYCTVSTCVTATPGKPSVKVEEL